MSQIVKAQGHFDSATDGDLDIAYSLLLAHKQWGSNGTVNYLKEAQDMITKGIKASNVTNNNRLNLEIGILKVHLIRDHLIDDVTP